ncbi:glutathione-dependent formaldehyde-activating enzyme [Colletotrichum nymphaeae SA-01]|uniref:Glutathione-dependent formaldehyde-activating enzyme n=1 Tax=Colletotrichum nymphaeae SA-01 TaxID=1460502 RepID=A0A135RNT2_9PEZI|nr:glutathione-dependent formaldehyde-activating enzyme [Colletotrichum nymphaeae SA-01]
MGLKGSCMCKAIKYENTEDPQVTALCHCTDCQKWSGSAFTSNAVVPRTSFKVTQGTKGSPGPMIFPKYALNPDHLGEPKFYDITGDSGKNNRHFFCSNCGSSLYTELDLMADVTCIKAGGLDEGKASLEGKPAVEFYCKDRVSYLVDVKGADQKPAFS